MCYHASRTPRIRKFWLLALAGGTLGIATAAMAAEPDLAKPSDKKAENLQPTPKVDEQPGVTRAAMAAQLALEGEKQKSPLLLLAAAELLAGGQESKKSKDGIKASGEKASAGDKQAPELTPEKLATKARKLAEGDAQLAALCDKRFEQYSTRGLVASQGAGKETVNVRGTTFKVISSGVIASGERLTLTNVIFEAKLPAMIAVVGDGDGDLDLGVFDGNNGGTIGIDRDSTSVCAIKWVPLYQGPFTVVVENNGRYAERYVVLANW